MRTKGALAVGIALALAAAGCSSGSAKVLVQHSDTPFPSASPSASVTRSSPGTASVRPHQPPTATTSPSASTVAATTAPPRTSSPPPSHAAGSTPKPTVSKGTGCSGGSTSTIQMTSPYRFSPATLAIKRCDSVKAVYADSTGVPHNWKGPGWSSPDMSSSGQSYTYRFLSTGTFSFYCSYHQGLGMTGKITVS